MTFSPFLMEEYMFYFFVAVALIVFSAYSYVSNKIKKDKKFLESIKTERKNKGKFDADKVKDLYIYSKDELDPMKMIDDITWNDLDMDKIFNAMDNNITSLGSEYLYRELHYLHANEDTLERRKAFYDLFLKKEYRNKIAYILNDLGKSDYNGLSVFMRSQLKRLKYSKLFVMIRFVPIILIFLFFYSKVWAGLLFSIAMCINVFIHYFARYKVKSELNAINYLSNVLLAAKKISSIDMDNEILNSYIAELKSLLSAYKNIRISFLNSDVDFSSIVGVLIEYYKALTLSDVVYYNEIVGKVIDKREITIQIIDMVAELDMCFAVSAYKNCYSNTASFSFTDTNKIEFVDLYHPLIDNPVTNTYDIKNALVTGSNATGKSTFIKALAISAIFSQSLGFAFASSFKFRKSMIMTSMAIRDNISSGESYFIREIKTLKRIVDRVENDRTIVFIDEILRGTNTLERISASEAVLRYLSKFDSIIIAATHDIELTHLLYDQYENLHFNEAYENGDIKFDYVLKEGPSESKNAIKLLEYMGFNNEVISNARVNANDYVRDK